MREHRSGVRGEFFPDILENTYTNLAALASAKDEQSEENKSRTHLIATALFKDTAKDLLVDFFEDLLHFLPTFYKKFPAKRSPKFSVVKGSSSFLDVCLTQCFVDYINSVWTSNERLKSNNKNAYKKTSQGQKTNRNCLDTSVTNGILDTSFNDSLVSETECLDERRGNGKEPNSCSTETDPVEDSAEKTAAQEAHWELAARVLDPILHLEFPKEDKFWHDCFIMLKLKPFEKEFAEFVAQKSSKGEASPAVINYCLRTTHLNKHLNGLRFLLQACLLGAPNGNTIETFLAEKSKDERRQGRALLCYLEAISVNDSWAACELMKRFCGYQPAFKKGEGFTLHLEERLEKFALNIQDALKSLRGKSSNNNKVDFYWGRSCVREIIKKYKDGKCSYEQMYDLTFNIMVQRPRLQDAIVSFFQEFLGRAEAERWVSLRPSSLNATNIPISQAQKISNVYAPFDDPDALAIPITTRVTVVQRREELMAAIEALNEAAESEFPFAGVDAEWSAYVPDSKASVLQVALQNQIFIFDLDKLPPDQSRKLFENLFGNRALIKVGFQFGEDLTKLRKVVPRTVFLYAPQSLLCITSVIAQVAIISWENDDPMISEEFFKKKEKEKEKGKRREKEKEDDSKKPPAVKDVVFKLKSLGLAKLVKAMTGMSLDKSEQCSVWNRRPLRTAQIRYGALDVSCLLLMMSKCLSYAKKWNVEIFGLMKPFYLEPSAMPLFFCDDCDPNIFPRIVIKEVLDELDEE